MTVKGNNKHYGSFPISNGVKQGGILSQILCCVYIDNRYQLIRNNDVGCHVGSHLCGTFR